MVSNRALTKFMEYRPEIFCYPRLKVTLPADFNDPFDSQLRLRENDTKKLSEKYNIPIEKVLYYAKRLQTVHILSLSRKHALDADSANMWGLYAKSGKGIAFEFDYNCVDYYLSNEDLKNFLSEFRKTVDKEHYVKNNLNEALYLKILESIRAVRDQFKRMRRFSIVFNKYPELFTDAGELLTLSYTECFNSEHMLQFICNTFLPNSISLTDLIDLPSHVYTVRSKEDDTKSMYDLFSGFIEASEDKEKQYDYIEDFMTTKEKVWEHEKECRVLIYDMVVNVINKADKLLSNSNHSVKNYELASKILDTATENIHFIDFSASIRMDVVEASFPNDTTLVEYGFIPKIYLPFPTKIYLGWDFDTESVNGKEQLKHIKEYTRKYGIELCKLKKEIDYTSEKRAVFMADEIKI